MDRLLSKKQVAELVGFHPEHVARLARQGHFPRPIKTGASGNCAVRFLASEVENWLNQRMAARQVQ